MKVALVYDRINKWGGAERVLLALKKIYPDAPLFTSVYDKDVSDWAQDLNIKTSFLQNVKFFRRHNELIAVLMPVAFESFSFDDYDVVISVTSEAAKGIITKPKTLHISYCLTPTRYLWSGYEDYFASKLLRILASPLVTYLRKWDLIASKRADHMIAISTEVKKRIKKYYRLDSELIFPPLSVPDKIFKDVIADDYFLVVSRLSKYASYKRIDLLIDAFNKLGWPLKIIGTGPYMSDLRKRGKENIEFLGFVSDELLWEYYQKSKAFIFPAIEDFGLAMAEAQYFGKPVIAFKGGGSLDIVRPGVTGEFFSEQKVSSIISVLKEFEPKRYNKKTIKENAMRFSQTRFEKAFKEFVDLKYKEHLDSSI